MGTKDRKTSLADALFSRTQQRLLGLLFGQPERSFFATELIRRVNAGSGAVQRQLQKLADSGLVTVTRIGNQKHYQANPDCPIFPEMTGLVKKTMGLAQPIRNALETHRDVIQLAAIFGSVAKGQATAASDIDLLVVSDSLSLEQLFDLLSKPEAELARRINPTLYTVREFTERLEKRHPFIARLLGGDTIPIIGTLPHGEGSPGESGPYRAT